MERKKYSTCKTSCDDNRMADTFQISIIMKFVIYTIIKTSDIRDIFESFWWGFA